MKKFLTYIFIISSATYVAQIGGAKSYRFLELPMPARSSALGGATMSIWDDDVNLGYSNPALLNPSCSKQLAFNIVNHVSNLSYGNFSYAHQLKKFGTFAAGLQFFNYGKFDGRDEYDIATGTFRVADYCLNLSIAKPIDKDSTLSIGATLKTIYSNYENYYSFANAVDVGLTYHNKHKLTISLVAKNYGRQWKSFSENGPKEALPFDFQFGVSKKVAKAPFRLIFQYDQLLKWNLTYVNPLDAANASDPFNTQPAVKSGGQAFGDKISSGFDKLSRHITLATEVIITKNFNVRIAYNFRKSKEMALPDRKVANGLSVGFGMKISKFHFNYGYSKYALAGNSHTFGITTNFNYFAKK